VCVSLAIWYLSLSLSLSLSVSFCVSLSLPLALALVHACALSPSRATTLPVLLSLPRVRVLSFCLSLTITLICESYLKQAVVTFIPIHRKFQLEQDLVDSSNHASGMSLRMQRVLFSKWSLHFHFFNTYDKRIEYKEWAEGSATSLQDRSHMTCLESPEWVSWQNSHSFW